MMLQDETGIVKGDTKEILAMMYSSNKRKLGMFKNQYHLKSR